MDLKTSVFGGIDVKGTCFDDIRTIELRLYLRKVSPAILGASIAEYSFKVVVICDSTVGKSCILKRCCENLFAEYSAPTIGADYSSRLIKVDDVVCCLHRDTAG